jgi:ribosomal protein S18 acetylase RimI-like enzyme
VRSLRSPTSADVGSLEEILLSSGPFFSDEECRIAVELIREGIERPHDAHAYQLLVAEDDGIVSGYVCFGSIPLTEGAYDLYWIAVAPARRGAGTGRALLVRVEEIVAQQGGRLIVAETSSCAQYHPTRRFYEESMGYESAARMRDFYKPGDDKIVYVKYVA